MGNEFAALIELASEVGDLFRRSPERQQLFFSIFDDRWSQMPADFLAPAKLEFPQDFVTLCFCRDVLALVVEAVLADSVVSDEEIGAALETLRPLSRAYSTKLNRYHGFQCHSVHDARDFLQRFVNDDMLFGYCGHNDRFSAQMCFLADVDRPEGLESFLRRWEEILTSIVITIVAADGLSEDEKDLLANLKRYVSGLAEIGRTNTLGQMSLSTASDRPTRQHKEDQPATEVLAAARHALSNLIGLSAVKREIGRLAAFLQVQEKRRQQGLKVSTQALHFVFTGNPGTGKTTVARILADILFGFGILKTRTLIECDRSRLVGGFVGQTAIKTSDIIEQAMDGVLFVDEAYSLASSTDSNDFGREAIDTLLKRMEDLRDRLVVIVAGYTRLMSTFLESNPGLKSRFTRFIEFEDYDGPELCQIFGRLCQENEYKLTSEGLATVSLVCNLAARSKEKSFGNARYVRTLFEQSIANQSERVSACGDDVSNDALVLITREDVPQPEIDGIEWVSVDFSTTKWRGICPGCKKNVTAGLQFLGKNVQCKCGEKWIFPWWGIEPGTTPGVPEVFLAKCPDEKCVGMSRETAKSA